MNPVQLDIGTVISLLVIGNLAALAILVANRSLLAAEQTARYFAWGKLLQAVAWALLRFRDRIPDFFSVYVGNAALLAGFALECLAVATADGGGRSWERTFAIIAALGIAAFCALAGTPNSRVVVASLATIAPYGALAAAILSRPRMSGLRVFISAGCIAYCLILAFRAATAVFWGANFGLMTPALAQTLAFVPQYCALIVSTIAFILLQKERGDALLRESEDKYRTLVEKASEAIIISQDGNLEYANPRMAELLGLRLDELRGQPIATYVWPADRAMVVGYHRDRLTGGAAPESYDYRLLRADGKSNWVSITVRVIDWKGRPAALCLLTDIEARKRSEERVAALLRDKELLLSEVHHRIKNSLAIAASLLSLQSEDAAGRPAEDVLLDARNRLQTLAQLYERLNATGDYESMSVRDYLPPLVQEITEVFPRTPGVRMELDIEDLVLDPNRLTSLGIMINEIVTNSMKHAFDGVADPAIRISLSASGGRVSVSCGDNGRGLPAGVDVSSGMGLGLRLIGMMAERLGAELIVERRGGTEYRIEFDMKPTSA